MSISLRDKESNSVNIIKILDNLINKYNSYENIVISCIFKNTKILSYGISKPDNHLHSIKNNKNYSVHAEIDAINNFIYKYKKKQRRKIGKVDILTTRFKFNDSLCLLKSHSCQFCIKSMNKFNEINRMYYTDNNNIYYNNFNEIYKNINNFGISKGDRRVYRY
jgi:hypothetical protein